MGKSEVVLVPVPRFSNFFVANPIQMHPLCVNPTNSFLNAPNNKPFPAGIIVSSGDETNVQLCSQAEIVKTS